MKLPQKKIKPLPIYISLFLFCTACGTSYTPKPRGYFRIDFPERNYQHFQSETCPFEFDYPTYGTISRDTNFLDTIPDNPCWFNINFPSLNGTLYLSYKAIQNNNTLSKLINDSHTLTYKHTIKANYIDESFFSTPNKVSGILYDLGGNTASAIQFFATDSTHNFIRGSLYFNSVPNADSMAPVIQFMRPDILHLLQTLKWKNT